MDEELMKLLMTWVELKDVVARQEVFDAQHLNGKMSDALLGASQSTRQRLQRAETALYDYARINY